MVAEQRRTFISYSRANKEFAVKLAKELRSDGYPIWLDQLDIPTGSRWDDELEKALQECSIFMIILTSASIVSMNVKDEIGYAIDHGKRILPVLLEQCQVPLRLSRFQYVDFTTKTFEDGVESAEQLLTSLINESTQKIISSGGGLVASQDGAAQATVEPEPTARSKRIAKQESEIGRKAKEEAGRSAKQPAIPRQAIIIVGLIVIGIGLIATFSSSLKFFPISTTKTSTPTIVSASIITPSPNFSDKTNISVFGQTGSIGILLSPEGQSQDLVNGIYAIAKDSRIAIIQNGASINLADGTSLYMPSGTVFILTKIQDGIELMLEQGSIMAKLGVGAVQLSIKTEDGFVAQVSGSIMGVQNSLEPLGIFVDCYEGHCTISGGIISQLSLDGPNRYLFYTDGNANPSDQTQRCEFWEDAIGAETIQGLGYCTQQQPIATYTPSVSVNAEATQQCENWLKDHHNKTTCP